MAETTIDINHTKPTNPITPVTITSPYVRGIAHTSYKLRHDRPISTKHAFFIEGGGTRGLQAIGVLKYLFDPNPHIMLDESIDIYGGTSVGSYIATALALGFNKVDILTVPQWIDLQKLFPPKYYLPLIAYRFLLSPPMYDNTELRNIMERILDYRYQIIQQDLSDATDGAITLARGVDLTLGHLRILRGYKPTIYKDLVINTVDLNMCRQVFFTTLESVHDHIKLIDAMTASSALPTIFKPLSLYYQDGVYRYEKPTETDTEKAYLCQLYDGGLCVNNPLDYFLLHYPNLRNYNIWLLKFLAVPVYTPIDGIVSLLRQLLYYLIGGKNEIKMRLIKDDYKLNVINICSQAGTLDVYTQEQIQSIIDHIYKECCDGKLFE